jgi:hypothetical protein
VIRPPAPEARSGRVATCEGRDAPQVAAAVRLSVGVRWEPVKTAVNGTPLARPRMTPVSCCAVGSTLTVG